MTVVNSATGGSSYLDLLAPPDPDALAALRQEATTERLVVWALFALFIVAAYVNLGVGLALSVAYGLSAAAMGALALGLAAIPLLGLIGLVAYGTRRARRVRPAVQALLEVTPRGWSRALGPGLMLVACAAGAALFAPLPPVANLGPGMVFGALALGAPAMQRNLDPQLPWWAIAASAGWLALAPIWMVALAPVLGSDPAYYVGLAWVMFAPHGLILVSLTDRVVRASQRDDRVGRAARAWSVFLTPAPQARILRERGDPAGALALLRRRLAVPLAGRPFGDALLETGEAMLLLGDDRAPAMFAGAAQVMPLDPRPMLGLARSFRTEAPAMALAYARAAEERATRSLIGENSQAAALREELERDG
jgi:hypothetical protein